MYKYKTVKELAETGALEYNSAALHIYLKRTEFAKFRKDFGARNSVYLFCPEFVKTWREFIRGLQERRKIKQEKNKENRKARKTNKA